MKIVDQVGFDAITCNRCGDCCEHLKLENPLSPREIADAFEKTPGCYYQDMTHEESLAEARMVADMLVPTCVVEGIQHYRCTNFMRDAQGLGVCTAYDHRPRMCARFPYGKPAPWPRCSWNVRIAARILPVVTEVNRRDSVIQG